MDTADRKRRPRGRGTPLTKTEVAEILGVTPRRMDTWLEADPRFPPAADVDGRGRRRWDEAAVRSYRAGLVTEPEFAQLVGVSVHTLYNRARSDPAFPPTVMPRTGRFSPLWRRDDAIAYAVGYAGAPGLPRPDNPAVVTFAEFAAILGIGVPGLHKHKKTDPHFPPALTTGRGALWARSDAQRYKRYREGAPAPVWRKHARQELDLVTVAEFAQITGLHPQTVVRYLSQGERGFPPPATNSRYPVWTRESAREYAQSRASRR